MFARAQAGHLPGTGIESSAGLDNPGMSVWAFVFLAKGFGITGPVGLARAVAMLAVLAVAGLALFAAFVVDEREREPWLWAVGLVAVNPVGVIFTRKIWTLSLFPILTLGMLAGWWKRDTLVGRVRLGPRRGVAGPDPHERLLPGRRFRVVDRAVPPPRREVAVVVRRVGARRADPDPVDPLRAHERRQRDAQRALDRAARLLARLDRRPVARRRPALLARARASRTSSRRRTSGRRRRSSSAWRSWRASHSAWRSRSSRRARCGRGATSCARGRP